MLSTLFGIAKDPPQKLKSIGHYFILLILLFIDAVRLAIKEYISFKLLWDAYPSIPTGDPPLHTPLLPPQISYFYISYVAYFGSILCSHIRIPSIPVTHRNFNRKSPNFTI